MRTLLTGLFVVTLLSTPFHAMAQGRGPSMVMVAGRAVKQATILRNVAAVLNGLNFRGGGWKAGHLELQEDGSRLTFRSNHSKGMFQYADGEITGLGMKGVVVNRGSEFFESVNPRTP